MGPRRSGTAKHRESGDLNISGMTPTEGNPLSSQNIKTKSSSNTVETSSREDTTASMKLAAMKLAERVVEYEERTIFLGDLIKIKRGTREVERFVRKQEALRHEAPEMMSREDIEEMILRERDNVMDSMTNKLKDNICKGARKGRELHQLKVRLFWGMRREDDRRKFNNTLNDRLYRKRKEVRKEHQVQLRAIRIDTKKEDKLRLPPELKRYSNVKIFQKDAAESYKPGVAIGPVVVGLEQGLLDEDEIAVLCRGPKFCVRRVLSGRGI